MRLLYTGSVVGVSFKPQRDNLQSFVELMARKKEEGTLNPQISLQHQPDNPHDKNAVKVFAGQDDEFYWVGFIPRTHNEGVLQYGLDKVEVFLEDFNTNYEGEIVGLSINVYGMGDEKKSSKDQEQSTKTVIP